MPRGHFRQSELYNFFHMPVNDTNSNNFCKNVICVPLHPAIITSFSVHPCICLAETGMFF